LPAICNSHKNQRIILSGIVEVKLKVNRRPADLSASQYGYEFFGDRRPMLTSSEHGKQARLVWLEKQAAK
jgi:hypothetical protein